MTELLLDETFNALTLDARLAWLHPPTKWSIGSSVLSVEPEAKTDYWQRTHYGFEADNGHFLFMPVAGDMILTTNVRFHPAHQYDQAGLLIRLSPHCWLKASVEYEPEGPNVLGAVVTNFGYSDWSTQNFPSSRQEISLRIRREGNDYIVEFLDGLTTEQRHTPWTQIRLAHLHDDRPGGSIQCGLYACSPQEAGLVAEFDFLKIETGRVE